MNSTDYDVITDILRELQQEYDSLQSHIENGLVKIKEKDCYIQSFMKQEDNEFKIFSPRNAEEVYREEIEQANLEKKNIQQKLNQYYHEQNLLRSKIEKLKKIIIDDKSYSHNSGVKKQNFKMLNIQEEDRQRIARDLHDTSLQNLAHLVHKIELCGMFIDQDPLRAKLELSVVSKNLKMVIEEIRNTIFNLRPMSFDDLGLKAAFEQLIEKMNENNKYETNIDISDVSCENELILVTIYRVVQECLFNITKHSEADKIIFYCKTENNYCIIDIEDNGIGFTREEMENKKDKHFGMPLIKERVALLGGTISIDSKRNRGTQIHMEIPLFDT